MNNNSHNMQISAGVTIYDRYGNIKEDRDFCQPKNAYENDIRIEVKDSDGNISEIQQIPFKSYTYNFANYHYYAGLLKDNGDVQIVNGGTKTSFLGGRDLQDLRALGNDVTNGIVVGTGSVSMSAQDYKLGGLCTNGTGSNQLLYGGMSFVTQSVSGSGYSVSALRNFANYGSESVFVKEMGVIGIMSDTVGSFNVLIIRDTMDITGSALNIEVPSSGTLTVRYNFEVNPECGLNKNWNTFYEYDMQGNSAMTKIRTVLSQSGLITYNDSMFEVETVNTGSIKGLVCGSGSAAVSIDDYRIGLIQNGAASGQLLYQPHIGTDIPIRSLVTGSTSFAIRRPFINASGAPIDINEVALWASDDSSVPIVETDCWQYSRFLTNGITLQDAETAEFRFVFAFTYV